MLFPLILINLLLLGAAHRHKRYLIYPNAGPARAQFIIGLGIPVDLKDASVTVGTVIKFQYLLPINSSEYTSRIYGFADTVSRDMNGETNELGNEESNLDLEDRINVENEKIYSDLEEGRKVDNLEVTTEASDNNDTLLEVQFHDRRKRSLQYTEGGLVNEENEINTELQLQEAIKRQELADEKNMEMEKEPERMNRWDYYKIIERMVERYGYTGRPCLLRTICEAAAVPFTHENGLLAEIGHILFTPSTTTDELSHHTDNEYHAAERLGRDLANCETLFPDCEGSILETFTTIGENTLHKFGLI